MGQPILLLRLEAPLQSWGVRARWDVRDTSPEPTKSGLVGLLGCALGCPTYGPRLEELDRALRLGVRVENPGRVLTDYQTVTDFLPTAGGEYKHSGGTAKSLEKLRADPDFLPATIVSPRGYLEDAAFLAAFAQADGGGTLLEECRAALENPRWPLFLGRKACVPTRPVYETLTDGYEGLEDALRRHPWSWLGVGAALRQRPDPTHHLEAFVEDTEQAAGPNVSRRQDAVRTNAARLYGFRAVRRFHVDLPTDQ